MDQDKVNVENNFDCFKEIGCNLSICYYKYLLGDYKKSGFFMSDEDNLFR